MLQHLAHGPEPVCTAIKGVGSSHDARLNTGFREIVSVDELVDILAVTEHRNAFPLVNPLEEDLKDSKPTLPHDRARPDDGDIQTVPCVFPTQVLSGKLGFAICLYRGWDGFLRQARVMNEHCPVGGVKCAFPGG